MIALDGRMAFTRAWFGDHIKRGAAVTVNGERARVLSARVGLVAVRMWTSGERVVVRPTELVAA